MAADNKTIGRFNLDGIAPAPRGVPQIEVTFDIDANGIVKVSAIDKGTGKEQNITITASTNLSNDEIDKAVKEAERFAAEDKKKKDAVEAKNHADTLIYQTEKTIGEMGDKITAADKDKINAEIAELKKAVESNDTDKIKAGTDSLTKVSYDVFGKIYQQQGAQGQNPGAGASSSNDDVADADYEVVDDDK